jgi:uncharacterized protein (TIGR02996 family)
VSHPDAFLGAIIESPEDDAPRLVFADWLEEHGEPERAEFIRAQVGVARLPEGDVRLPALEARAKELQQAKAAAWLGPLDVRGLRAKYRRGFAEEVYCSTPGLFFAHAEDLFGLLPLRSLTIHSVQGDVLDPAGARALAAMPQLARLEELLLWDHDLGDEGTAVLAACPHLSNLRALSLANCGVGPGGAAALAASPYLKNLLRLDLCSSEIGVEGARTLLRSPHLDRLIVLDVGETFYGQEEGEDDVIDELTARFGDGLIFGGGE